MAPELEQAIAAAQAAVQQQGDTVRSLKASLKDGNAQQSQVEEAIQKLQQLKLELSGEQQQQQATAGNVGFPACTALHSSNQCFINLVIVLV